MARLSVSVLAACLALAACGGGGTQLTTLHRNALADSVRDFLDQYVETVNRDDFSAILPFYADDEDFHWADGGRIAYPSYQSLVTAFDSLSGVIFDMQFMVDEPKVIPLRPGLATLTATYRQTLVDTAGQEVRWAGAFSAVVAHRDDGWKFLTGHASSTRNPQ
jgi:ketosteroid isomerase-like protein